MDVIALIAFVACVYLTIRIAARRGRNVRTWAWIAALAGPLAIPLLLMFPDRHCRNGGAA
jgi:hypothetical protein